MGAGQRQGKWESPTRYDRASLKFIFFKKNIAAFVQPSAQSANTDRSATYLKGANKYITYKKKLFAFAAGKK